VDETIMNTAREVVTTLLTKEVGSENRAQLNVELAGLLNLRAEGQVALIPLPDLHFAPGGGELEIYVEVENTGDSSALGLHPLLVAGPHVAIPWSLAPGLLEAKSFEAVHSHLGRLAVEGVLTPDSEQAAVIAVEDESVAARGMRVRIKVFFRVETEPPDGAPGSGPWIRVLKFEVLERRRRS
jgi:hypothetical protein